jgi:hypothetical protein
VVVVVMMMMIMLMMMRVMMVVVMRMMVMVMVRSSGPRGVTPLGPVAHISSKRAPTGGEENTPPKQPNSCSPHAYKANHSSHLLPPPQRLTLKSTVCAIPAPETVNVVPATMQVPEGGTYAQPYVSPVEPSTAIGPPPS